MIRRAVASLLLLSIALIAEAAEPKLQVRKELGKPFKRAGITGGIVVYDLKADRWMTSDRVRATTRFAPASTFKIPNSLIALETGAAKDENEFMPWDGVPKRVSAWNRDFTMAEAMKASAVWFYQELARRIGAKRMQEWLDRLDYGNRQIGQKVDMFWLEGPLKISPVEQIEFLVRLYREELPASKRSQQIVKKILGGGKTGWTDAFTPAVGWYVGYEEANGTTYFFATNVEIRKDADAGRRIPLTKEVLAMVQKKK